MPTGDVEQKFVTIVGRPNVGKSSLFNKLAGQTRVRTGPEPGVTRDRITETIRLNDKPFTLVDTAGFDRSHTAPDPSFVIEQVEEMIELSTLILFVVDVQAGPQPLDRSIADKLYPHSDRVLLTVNKADNPDYGAQATDFYELGFRDVIPVSATTGRGLDELRSTIVDRLPAGEPERPEDRIRVSLIGRPNVGKSTFFNRVVGYERAMVDDERGTTRDVISIGFEALDRRFEFMDTVGMEDPPDREGSSLLGTSLRAVQFSHVVGLMVDYENRITRQDQRLAGLIQDAYRGGIILINKAEERDEEVADRWLGHVEDRLGFFPRSPVLFTSARTGEGIQPFFEAAIEIFDQMHRRIQPEDLRNAFLDLKPRISWSTSAARTVRLQDIEQLGVDPPTFRIRARDVRKLRAPDLRHLKSLLRDQLDLPYSPIKLQLKDPTREETAVS